MELPRKYSYGPPSRILTISVLFFATVTFFMAYLADHPNTILLVFSFVGPSGATSLYRLAGAGFGFIGVVALLALARRIFDRPSLVLEDNELVLPRGMFRTSYAHIPYSAITRVQEVRAPGRVLLFVCTESASHVLKASFFPDAESYSATRDFLQSFSTETP